MIALFSLVGKIVCVIVHVEFGHEHAIVGQIRVNTLVAAHPFRQLVPWYLRLLQQFHRQKLLQCQTLRSPHFAIPSSPWWFALIASLLLLGNSFVYTSRTAPIVLRWNLILILCTASGWGNRKREKQQQKLIKNANSFERSIQTDGLTAFFRVLLPRALCGFSFLYAWSDRVAFARFVPCHGAHLAV